MSGHSKWSTIKHKKAATDAKRGKAFSRIAREIMVAAKVGGGDPSANITLRALIQKARAANMPSDNVDRAIKKGTGELGNQIFEEMIYEGYAPGGVGLVVRVLTDNRNRTAAEIRHIFTRHSANMAAQGAVARLFQRKGQIVIDDKAIEEDRLLELALEAGAEDLKHEDDKYEIITEPANFMSVVDAINKANLSPEVSEETLLPVITVPVTDKAQAAGIIRFVEALEDLDDVQGVYANFDIDDSLLAAISDAKG